MAVEKIFEDGLQCLLNEQRKKLADLRMREEAVRIDMKRTIHRINCIKRVAYEEGLTIR